MDIVHIFWGLNTGGVETMLVNIANEQVKYGHKVHIIIINNLINNALKNKLFSDIDFICLNRRVGSKNPLFILRLNIILLKIHPNVIHIHDVELINLILPLWRNRSILTVHHLPDNITNSYNKYRKVISISDSVRDALKHYYGIESKTIFNGIPIQSFRQRKNTQNRIVNIIQVGRLLHETKGQDILLQAFYLLIKKGHSGLSLTFVGMGESLLYLKELVKKYNISNHVNFAGIWQQEYLFEHLADYDLLVQPSRFEGFGLTVAEAMAAKVPVLVSDNQGPMEIINKGEFGYFFTNNDVDDCVRKLSQIVLNGIDDEMIDNGYNYVNKMFDVKCTAQQYIEVYKAILLH